jgi:methyltransferase
MTAIAAVVALVVVPMLIEAQRASANERRQRGRGGIEPSTDRPIYAAMRLAYPGAFAAMLVEGAIRGGTSRQLFALGLGLFGLAKILKWWAILTLGPFWTFRVIVVPSARRIDGGPYRIFRHPNYIGVVGELAGAALMTGAAVCGPVGIVLFGILLKRRIRVEEEALASTARHPPCSL